MLYANSNLTATYSFALGTQPTEGDIITINGVTFTFASTIGYTNTTYGSTKNNVLIETDANTTCGYLINAINQASTGVAQSGAGTKFVAVTQDDADFLTGFTATDGTNLFTMVSKH